MKIPVIYTDAQVHDACSFSKSPLKPGLLARRIALDPAFEIKGSVPMPDACRLKQIHDHDYIDGLMDSTRTDGFGNRSAKDFKAIRYTVGNMLTAAEWATDVKHPGVVWSLTAGFHHACYADGGGFCTIEGLTLAAYERQKFAGTRTLIVDEDAHFGNGCIDIIERAGMQDYCLYMQSRHTHLRYPDAEVSLQRYRRELVLTIAKFKPDLILYQAGADNWVGDGLCGNLTMTELYDRDATTFEVAKMAGVPVVANLAGGYAPDYEDTLRIHMNTGEAMKEVYLGIKGEPFYPTNTIEQEQFA